MSAIVLPAVVDLENVEGEIFEVVQGFGEIAFADPFEE
jgi:hypothetical protein